MSALPRRTAPWPGVLQPGSESGRLDAGDTGGKADGLLRLLAAGFSVPRFWIVPARTLAGIGPPALMQLPGPTAAAATTADVPCAAQDLAATAQRLSTLLLAPDVRERLSAAIAPDLVRELDPNALYAVRSSAIGEDSATASYAGQLDSFLNVPVDGLVAAILKVWVSAYSARALAYRARRACGRSPMSTAVIIQEMVPAVASGVLFTRHPESGERTCVIAAGLGLGEGTVSDRVPSDTFRVDWLSGRIEREIVDKDLRVVRDAAGGHGTRLETVPAECRLRPALTDGEILALRDIGVRAERALGAPQDIEWAFDAIGQLLLLQARPIVSHPKGAQPGSRRLWDNSNIAESYPGITLPLTFTFARRCYEAAFSRYMRQRALDYRLFGRPFQPHRHLLGNMIGLLNGRVYYDLTTWYRLMSFLPGFRRVKASWDRMVGVAQSVDCPSRRAGPAHRACAWAWCVWKLLTVRGTAQRFAADFDTVYARFAALDFESATAEELLEIYHRLAHELGERWSLTLDNDFSAMAYYEGLRLLCARWLPAAHAGLYNDLLCGERDMDSVAPLRALAALAAAIARDAPLLRLLRSRSELECWQAIESRSSFAPIRHAIETYIAAYGDRGAEDLKLDRASFRERPELLVAAIRRQLESGVAFEAAETRERSNRAHAHAELDRLLRNPLKRIAIRFMLRRARLAIVSREHMRFARTRVFGIVRGMFRGLGERLAESRLIPAGSDIHYLTLDEVLGLVEGASVTRNLDELIKLRKSEYAGFAAADPGDRFWTHGSPYACDLAGAPAAATGGELAAGTACASGAARGIARVVHDPGQPLPPGAHVLVARSTDPGWVFLLTQAQGLIVERGSVLSHTAIIGRELGIPTIVGVKDATRRIPDGARVSMDGGTGRIAWVSEPSASIAS